MLWIKLASVAAFVWGWTSSKRRLRAINVSDAFCLAFLVIFLPYFFINPGALSSWHGLTYPDAAIVRGQLAIILMLLLGGAIFFIRSRLDRGEPRTRFAVDQRVMFRLAIGAALISAAILVAILATPDLFRFRWATWRWIAGDVNGSENGPLRRMFSGGLYDDVLGRLRFTVMPILLLFMLAPLIRGRHWIAAALAAMAFLVTLPLSLSKLPFVVFAAYVLLFGALHVVRNPSIGRMAVLAVTAVVGAVIALSLLNMLQYHHSPGYSTFGQPFRLAAERIWGESYSIVLRYLTVYPDRLSFTGWSGIATVARLLGMAPRFPDIEVASIIIGDGISSNPGVFFLGGYAAFGDVGLVGFIVLGWLTLWAVDAIGAALKTELVHRIYVSIMAVNCLFLLQIALQTALISYGVAVVPALLLVMDRLLARGRLPA
jgi:hypothetical protein